MRAGLALLAVAIVVASILVGDGAASLRVVTGTVAHLQSGESISVVNEQTDPAGVPIALRRGTIYENREALRVGARVTVEFRSVGERRPVADRVRVLPANLRP